METFADYILAEPELIRKMEIVYYLQKRTGIFYDNSVILKTEIAKLFIEEMNLPVDENLVLFIVGTLLCGLLLFIKDVMQIFDDGLERMQKIVRII